MYNAFLSVKGRVQFDAIISKPETDDQTEFWLDVAKKDVDGLKKHLKRFAMRKHVKVEELSSIVPFCISDIEQSQGNFFVDDLSFLTNEVID